MSVELFKDPKIPEHKESLKKNFKVTAKPELVENLKRSWKKSWKVMGFKELKRVRTPYLPLSNGTLLRT